jgi:hypothetical protein
VSLDVLGDLLDESNERFNFRLTGATSGVVIGAYPVAHVDILDDDTATFVIDDVSVAEGAGGTTTATFTVSFNGADHEVGLSFATADDTATIANNDYQSNSGVLTFTAGQTSKTVTVLVNGDTNGEPNETFFVNLSSPTGGATVGDNQGVGTIVNDDSIAISINDITKYEMNTGVHGFSFVVSLSAASPVQVWVDFATADGTAMVSDIDYYANSGTVTFFPGQTSKVVTVQAKGDRKVELDEQFYVNLTNPINATIFDAQGVGTLLNEDVPPIFPTLLVSGGSPLTSSASGGVQPLNAVDAKSQPATADAGQSRSGQAAFATIQDRNGATRTDVADLGLYALNVSRSHTITTSAADDDFDYSIDTSIGLRFATLRGRL